MGTKDKKPDRKESDSFEKLMNQSGVTKLGKKTRKKQLDQPLAFEDEAIVFDDTFDWRKELASSTPPEKFSGRKNSPPRKSLRKLKITRGFTPDDILDLHGETRDTALSRVQNRVQTSERGNYQALLIITGKGINSKERGGVLGKAVWDWLKHHQVDHPIRFQWAPVFLGGKGAILVFF